MNTQVTPGQANSPQMIMNSLQSLPTPNQGNSAQVSTINSPTTSQELPQTVVSQPSVTPAQNTAVTLQLNLPDLVQNTEPNKCLMSTVNKSENGSALQSHPTQSTTLQCSSDKTQDSDAHSCTLSSTNLPNATQGGKVDSPVSCAVASNPNVVGPQIPKLEDGSDSNDPTLSKHTEIVNAILKIKQELNKCLDKNSCSSTNSSAVPSTSTSMPSNPGSTTQEPGNQVSAENDTQSQSTSNSNLPPVNIGACLLCGGDCGCEAPDSEEEEEKGFLPPPPMSSVEVDSLFGKLKEQDKETPAEPASVINTKLHLHQKQALSWMINKENCNDLGPFWREISPREWFNEGTKTFTDERPTCIKGGILADDMGLGKTLTIISLIFTNHLDGKPMFMKKENTNSKKRRISKLDTADDPLPQNKKPSLDSAFNDEGEVVVIKKEGRKKEKKAVAIKKRKEEIMNRKRLLEDKKKKDPGAMFRQIFLPKILKKKEKQENKVKKEKTVSSPVKKPVSMDITQPSTSKNIPDVTKIDDDDDDDDIRDDVTVTAATPTIPIRPNKLLVANPVPNGVPKATLIICPLSVLSNWTDQICSHVHTSVHLKVYMYYGAQRIKDLKYLSGQDIVLTTYPTLANDFRSMTSSPLHKIKWLRVILDEGHMIRNKRTTLSKAVLLLEAERRWVVTGTPIQNRIEDLKTIILYLRLEPFNDNKWWKKSIENLRNTKNSDLADFRLNTLIKHVSIRRLKDEKVDNSKLVELPPKQVVIQDIELSDEERKLYDMMQLDGQSIIRRYIRHDSVLKHYGHCFAILMKLRQMCLHPRLCKEAVKELQQALERSKQDEDTADDNDDDNDDSRARLIKVLMEAIASGDSEECAICLESLNDPVVTPCAHVFCCGCITDVLNSEGLAPKCPMCRAPVDEIDLLRVPEEQRNKNNETVIDVDDEANVGDSAKIKALISSLEAIRDKDPSTKSVVVSQFTSFLNIIEEYLDKHGFGYLRLDGTMSLDERFKALEEFNEPGVSTTVFLLSMSAGGTGINLTGASRVFLMDPAWNPAVEEQCFDRCHRMGQTKEVIITKYIVMDSVEERMLTLQEQKRQLMSQAFGAKAQSEEDRNRTRVRDIAHLIGLRPARQVPNRGAQ